jgi:hypothetical protein
MSRPRRLGRLIFFWKNYNFHTQALVQGNVLLGILGIVRCSLGGSWLKLLVIGFGIGGSPAKGAWEDDSNCDAAIYALDYSPIAPVNATAYHLFCFALSFGGTLGMHSIQALASIKKKAQGPDGGTKKFIHEKELSLPTVALCGPARGCTVCRGPGGSPHGSF